MTLTPENRVTLTDALRPPPGYRVDVAVGTTYSMNLMALLLAPLSFALYDQLSAEELEGEAPPTDPIRTLEAVRRYAARTTVFCQAGAIHVPPAYRSILTFVEDSVLEVAPPPTAQLFHPKLWAIRFVDQNGVNPSHRVVILSRNLTLDRSWDTALILDQANGGTIDAAPAAGFIQQLPNLCLAGKGVNPRQLADIESLTRTLARVKLAPPRPFTSGHLVPVGMSNEPVWPFPIKGQRVLAISPFLTATALRSLLPLGECGERTLLSRAEALEHLGSNSLAGWNPHVLQKLAETRADGDLGETVEVTSEVIGTQEGLHAKTVIVDVPGSPGCEHKGSCRCVSHTITGSANLTRSPWGESVEFDAVLIGPTRECGVRAVLDDKAPEAPGLNRLLDPFTPASPEGVFDATIATSYEIEAFHRALAGGGPELLVRRLSDDHSDVTLTITVPERPPGPTRVWLASLPQQSNVRDLAAELTWSVAPIHVTPFLAIETTAGDGNARLTKRCVIKAALSGEIGDRQQQALSQVLNSKEAVLKYLIFLLGDPSYESLFSETSSNPSERWGLESTGQFAPDVALFEPLVRAVGRDEDALARVASLVQQLRTLPDGDDLVPDGFDELWDIVWQAHREQRG